MKWIPGLAVALSFLSGCASIGPPTVARDRFDYVEAISDSWKRQMLLNLLKVRYADAPVFLDVTSVISSYEFHGQAGVFGQRAPEGRAGDSFAGVSANGSYTDRPTITYAPLSSDKFARSLMSPIPISGIALLIQAGYPVDVVLRVCANSVNGLENSFGGRGERRGDPRFHEMTRLLRAAQESGHLVLHLKKEGDQQRVMLYLRKSEDAAVGSGSERLATLLGLDPALDEFTVVYGARVASRAEVAIQSRSMMQVMADFGSYIDVPRTDIEEGRVFVARRQLEHTDELPALLHIRNSSDFPEEAHVAVRYRESWYWIDDRDHTSKAAFNYLMQLFSLTETGATQAAPVVTVPAR